MVNRTINLWVCTRVTERIDSWRFLHRIHSLDDQKLQVAIKTVISGRLNANELFKKLYFISVYANSFLASLPTLSAEAFSSSVRALTAASFDPFWVDWYTKIRLTWTVPTQNRQKLTAAKLNGCQPKGHDFSQCAIEAQSATEGTRVEDSDNTYNIFWGLITKHHLVQIEPVAIKARFWVSDSFSAGLKKSPTPARTTPHFITGALHHNCQPETYNVTAENVNIALA